MNNINRFLAVILFMQIFFIVWLISIFVIGFIFGLKIGFYYFGITLFLIWVWDELK